MINIVIITVLAVIGVILVLVIFILCGILIGIFKAKKCYEKSETKNVDDTINVLAIAEKVREVGKEKIEEWQHSITIALTLLMLMTSVLMAFVFWATPNNLEIYLAHRSEECDEEYCREECLEECDEECCRSERFEIIDRVTSWYEAKFFSEGRHGRLAEVSTEVDLMEIAHLAEQAGVNALWLGATKDEEGDFHWINEAVFNDFDLWLAGRPRDRLEYPSFNYLVMLRTGDDWFWADVPSYALLAEFRLGFVVQFD